MTVARTLEAVLGPDLPIAVRAYDGSRLGLADAPATLLIRSPKVFRRLVSAPGELGLGRAYVSGELDVEGDLYAALAALRDRIPDLSAFGARQWADVLRLAGSSLARSGRKPLPVPAEEAHLRGVRHSKEPDAAAIAHHYDVSNAFYRIALGPSMNVLVRGVGAPRRHARAGAGRQGRARVPKARAGARDAAARRGLRLGRDGPARGHPPRRASGRRDPLAPPGRVGRQ